MSPLVLVRDFVIRDLKARYRNSFLGYLWTLSEPLSLLAVYTLLFKVLAPERHQSALQVLLGILPWLLFSNIVTSGTLALSSRAGLIKKIYVPRHLFILSDSAQHSLHFVLQFLAVAPWLVLSVGFNAVAVLLGCAGIALIVCLATGLAFVLSAMQVVIPDTQHIVRLALRVGFYLSPVVYPLEWVPQTLQHWYALNPLTTLLTLARGSTQSPHFVLGIAIAAAVALTGAAMFRRVEQRVVRYL